ncbi:MAG: hypothetical protein VX938_12390, partial [Myxococcota bacterium]|nr:hypothetical protein [Myxococcota bacterium]
MLLSGGNQGGIICPAAVKAGAQASTPLDEVGALTNCESLRPQGARIESPALWSTNAVLLGVLPTIHELASAPLGEGIMVPLLTQQIERLKKLSAEPIVLPVPVIASPLRPHEDQGDWVVSIRELGAGGLVRAEKATGTLILGADDVRVGLRPTVRMTDGVVESVSLASGLPAGGRRIATREELAELAKKGDVRHLIASALAEVWLATQKQEEGKDKTAPESWDELPVNLVVDARAPSEMVGTVMSTLKTLGANAVAFAKTATHGSLLHLLIREVDPSVLTDLNVGYERPLLAVVYGDHIDLWRPTGPMGEPRTSRKPGTLPSSLLPGFRGNDLQRLRLTIPDGADGLSLESLEQLRMGMGHLLALTGAGPLLHVVAGPGSRAADVLRIARV